jgi:hypothetical protein
MRNLALFGGNGREHRYLMDHVLAATVAADYAPLSEIDDVKSLGKCFVAMLTEKYVLRHGRFSLTILSAHIITRSAVCGSAGRYV